MSQQQNKPVQTPEFIAVSNPEGKVQYSRQGPTSGFRKLGSAAQARALSRAANFF